LPPLEVVEPTEEELVKMYFSDIPVMIDVAFCESTFRHTKDGKVLRGHVDKDDLGVLQINRRYHEKKAKELGYDLYTLMGNLRYGRYLYETQGLEPWKASRHCWEETNQH
jgi:hypothetical protein